MRVGRIIPIKMMSHKDVTALLKMFAKKGVATAARQELSQVDKLTPNKDNDIKSKINARNSLNDVVVDSTKESLLRSAERKTGILAERQKIDIIKNMEKAKEGVKISSLDFLAKSQVNTNFMKKTENDDTQTYTNDDRYNNNMSKSNDDEKNTKKIEQSNEKQKSISSEYDELLKTLAEKKEKEKLDSEKETTEKKDKQEKKYIA